MAKDYKHRVQHRDYAHRRRHEPEPSKVGVVKWMLATTLIIGFVVFLVYLKSPELQKRVPLVPDQGAASLQNADAPATADKSMPQEKQKVKKPQPPQFDFYTILPKKEIVVPEHELKTRTREEQVGKNKKASYVIQAGSTQDFQEADQLKAKLALMGIESKIQKAKVEKSTWYRVKIGPYTQMVTVNTIMARLQKNGMKPVITEVDNQ